ncbi:MAG: hypothetical protein STSR0009_11980 [Methanoregula sp.]
MKPKTIVLLLVLLCVTVMIGIPAAAMPDRVFAPYTDTVRYPPFSLTDMAQKTGVMYYTLAFITSDSAGNPAWAGVVPLSQMNYRDQVTALRAMGGDVIISFGGANGVELAQAASDAGTLAGKYQAVIDAYNVTWVDFDIEGAAVAQPASVDLRNKAIRILQEKNPNLKVAYCLPVIPYGLTADGIAVLRNAKNNNVTVDIVNVMAMDFGDGAAPAPQGKMGEYVIQSAQSVFSQLKVLYPEKTDRQIWAMIGITPMIGQNDVVSEVFTLADARNLSEFAQANGCSLIAMWSANRDNGSCGSRQWSDASCSGIIQDEFAFSRTFNGFTNASPTPQPSPVPTTIPTTQPTPSPTVTPTPVPTTPVPTIIPTTQPTPAPTVTPTPQPTTTPSPGVEPWSPTKVYVKGDEVSYIDEQYQARWWTQGDVPGIADVWKLISTTGVMSPAPWSPDKVYTAGNQVLYLTVKYQAQWWTRGDVPGVADVWKLVSGGGSPGPALWSPDKVYMTGDQVLYLTVKYQAQWWTRGDVPGVADVWKPVSSGSTPAIAEWNPAKTYTSGDQVLYKTVKYQAQWWTRGDTPGGAPVWKRV